jgi:hypothetical protein
MCIISYNSAIKNDKCSLDESLVNKHSLSLMSFGYDLSISPNAVCRLFVDLTSLGL